MQRRTLAEERADRTKPKRGVVVVEGGVGVGAIANWYMKVYTHYTHYTQPSLFSPIVAQPRSGSSEDQYLSLFPNGGTVGDDSCISLYQRLARYVHNDTKSASFKAERSKISTNFIEKSNSIKILSRYFQPLCEYRCPA